ncbi:hypothetical protein P7C70_g4160, partial [Phenoliferia sp. Uapishka_3]
MLKTLLLATAVLATFLGTTTALVITFPLEKRDLFVRGPSRFSSAGVPLGGAHNAYFATLNVGTPPVQYLTLLDTGSSDLVIETAVQSNSCDDCKTTGPLYDTSKSSTSKPTTTPVSLQYGIGSDSGVVVEDLISVGNFSSTQAFAACDVNEDFSLVGASTALLGLGWQAISAIADPNGALESPSGGFASGTQSSSGSKPTGASGSSGSIKEQVASFVGAESEISHS